MHRSKSVSRSALLSVLVWLSVAACVSPSSTPVRRKKSVRDGESQRFCLDELLLPVAKAVGVSTPAIELPAAYRPQRLLMLCRNDP
jgi:hypothetical protein